MTNLNVCPKCGSLFNIRLLTACDSVTHEVFEQPVIACEKGCIVVPYISEQQSRQLISELDKDSH